MIYHDFMICHFCTFCLADSQKLQIISQDFSCTCVTIHRKDVFFCLTPELRSETELLHHFTDQDSLRKPLSLCHRLGQILRAKSLFSNVFDVFNQDLHLEVFEVEVGCF